MKVLKGFASVLLAGIMLLSLSLFSGVFLFRTFLSGPTLGSIAKSMIESNKDFEMTEFFEGASFNSEEIDELLEDFDEYLPKEEIYDEIGELASQMIRYTAGNIDHIDSKQFKETMKKAAKAYEKKTGETVDFDEIEDGIDEMVKEMEKDADRSETPSEVVSIFNVVYSNGILIGCAVVFVVCGLLIVVMFKSIKPLLIHLAIIGFIHGIVNFIFVGLLGITNIFGDTEEAIFFLEPIKGLFLKTALICFAVAIISIVLIIILSVVKKKEPVPVQPVQQQ